MVLADSSTKFSDLRPVNSDPPLHHFWGFGFYFYGERDFDLETVSFIRTLCFCLLYIPVVACRAYRVTPTEDGWGFLGQVRISPSARVLSLLATFALLGGSGYLGFEAYWNHPEVVASRNLAEAERLEAEGLAYQVPPLLEVVAEGPTPKARLAQDRLAKMIDPTTRLDSAARRAALLAAVKLQKGGRWRGSSASLQERGLAVASAAAADDPAGAWAVLDAVASLVPANPAEAKLRHDLLEKLFASDPSNVDWASRLAVDCESRGEFERCEKVLSPLRARLGDLEGARVLALVDARANRFDQAIPLLRDYTKNGLDRLLHAEERLRTLYTELQKRIIKQLETEHVYDFNYDGYSRAGVSGKKEIVMQYLQAKAKKDTEITRAEENVIAESRVVPAAMELGVVLIQHAQAETNPQARKSLFDEAEATFLAISRIAGDRDEFQLSLGQVYYWQGRHAEGKTLFDQVLKDHNRDPEWLLQVANLLRDLGSDSEARKLGEEAFNKSAPGELKSKCALLVAILSDDTEERIDWLKKADTNDIHVKATLLEDEATQALEKGNEPQAIANLKQVVSIYESMPESPGSLNNGWIALSRLATLTGDRAARDRADAMIARAAALGPGNSLTLHNASNSSLEASLRDVIGPSIDLSLIRSVASLELVEFLVGDELLREAYVARLRTHPGVNRTLSMMEKVILLAPQNPSFYQSPARVLLFRKDVEGLRKLLSSLNRTQLDLSDQARRARDALSGQKDLTKKRAAQASLAFIEPILPVARAKGGPTFAVAASLVIRARMAAATHGVQTDHNALVSLAEEAFSRSPSLASRWYLVNALLFRAEDRLARSDSRFAAIRERSFRVVSTMERLGIVLCVEGPLKKRALEDSDVNHALNLLHESHNACPSYTSGPMSWGLLNAKNPEDSLALARLYGQSEWDRIHDEINARLNPYDVTNTLKAYWLARMENRENEALKIMKDASSNGFPVPINTP